MVINRFFVGLLLVVGLIGVHAQSDEDSSEEFAEGIASGSKYRRLNGSASTRNPANEDYSSAEDAISKYMMIMGVHKRPNSSITPLSGEDYNWHIKEGEKVLKALSEHTERQREMLKWFEQLRQAKQGEKTDLVPAATTPETIHE